MNICRIVSKQPTKKALFYLIAALLGGCLPVASLHPLYTDKDVIFEKELLGKWVDDPNNPEFTWQFSRIDGVEKAYGLVCPTKKVKKAHLLLVWSGYGPKEIL